MDARSKRRGVDLGDRQRIALRVGIGRRRIGRQHGCSAVKDGVFVGRKCVIHSDRRVVDAVDRDRHRRRVEATIAVADRVVECFRIGFRNLERLELAVRIVAEGAV